jgi:ATP-dependent DNA helicase RecG
MHNPLPLQSLRESTTLECKLALGRDGKGTLPSEFFPTYSAFANTHGGTIILGIKEKNRTFTIENIPDPEKIITDLFNTLNNPQKVNLNLLTEDNVKTETIEGKTVIVITVPPATRKQKPIHLTHNPFQGNTYIRLHEGDRKCDDDRVKRMLADQVHDTCDQSICEGYTLDDLDPESIKIYRNLLKSEKPGHPWAEKDDQELLTMLGGWRHDRSTGEKGLTLAGMLMFGKWPNVTGILPHYFLDYQEKSADPKSDTRWLDRLVPDGTWSGNIFDFYRKVYRKLIEDLKVPFSLKEDVRQDDTPAHQAIREALVNCLVHADYRDRISILVTKHPKGFSFRNPGTLRVPADIALEGGTSDCRNQTLQQMFLMIGLGERAGSGLTKIIHGWKNEGHGLELRDEFEPLNHTILDMNWKTDDRVNVRGNDLLNDRLTKNITPDDGVKRGKNQDWGEKWGKKWGENARRILEEIHDNPKISIVALAEKLSLAQTTIENNIKKLKDAGVLVRVGPAKGGHWKIEGFPI